jgi:hypothetical protein
MKVLPQTFNLDWYWNWAPDGVYTRFVSPIIFFAWVAVVSGYITC